MMTGRCRAPRDRNVCPGGRPPILPDPPDHLVIVADDVVEGDAVYVSLMSSKKATKHLTENLIQLSLPQPQ